MNRVDQGEERWHRFKCTGHEPVTGIHHFLQICFRGYTMILSGPGPESWSKNSLASVVCLKASGMTSESKNVGAAGVENVKWRLRRTDCRKASTVCIFAAASCDSVVKDLATFLVASRLEAASSCRLCLVLMTSHSLGDGTWFWSPVCFRIWGPDVAKRVRQMSRFLQLQ